MKAYLKYNFTKIVYSVLKQKEQKLIFVNILIFLQKTCQILIKNLITNNKILPCKPLI